MPRLPPTAFLLVALALGSSMAGWAAEPADNWPQFLGSQGMAVSANADLPSVWSTTENVEWTVEVPGVGWSSPIVWGDKVFLTTAISETGMKEPSLGVDFSNDYVAELQKQGLSMDEIMARVNKRDGEYPDEVELTYSLFCYELESGRRLWRSDFYEGSPPAGRHRKNSYVSETPVTDGEAVYVYVAFQGLYAFDLDGKELWRTPLEPYQVYLDFGGGASPALYGDRLFILNDNEEHSFVSAYDRKTGEHVWTTPRAGLGAQRSSAWSTPFVWRNEVRAEVVTIGPGVVISYGLDGEELWRMGRMAEFAIASPFVYEGLLYVTSGVQGEPNKPIAVIRPGAEGDITPAEKTTSNEFVVWYDRVAGGTYLPTPLVADGGLFTLTDAGIFAKLDPATGKRLYRSRIHPTARNFTASPWAYDGKIFAMNEEGDTFVMSTGEEFELLGINSLDEFSMATPAIAGDRLLIRTQGRLYSIRAAGDG